MPHPLADASLKRLASLLASYGLGLPIAQEAVRAHGGKIWVETVADTNLFCVRLPLRRAGWRRK